LHVDLGVDVQKSGGLQSFARKSMFMPKKDIFKNITI